ncbi:hypothetical protein NKG94_49450 [Micromonospora sp. M12]
MLRPLRDLVRRFGGNWPASDLGEAGDLGEVLRFLDDFSARHWDFRGGRERPEAREPDLDPATAELVLESAAALGLIHPMPPTRPAYAHLVVLGGLAHACVRRVGYAAHLLRAGLPVSGEVAVLGSFRQLSEWERRTLADAGLPADDTEVDVLDTAVRRVFGLATPAEQDGVDAGHPHHSWSSRTYRPDGLPPIRVLAAPSSEPDRRRAHRRHPAVLGRSRPARPGRRGADGHRADLRAVPALRRVAHPGPAVRMRHRHGGVDPTLADLAVLPEQTLTPGRYLQEIRSAIRSMRALHTR